RLLARWLEIPWATLMMMPEEEKYAALNRALSGFWFVGAHTDCDRLIAAIAGDLGLATVARRRNTACEWQKRVAGAWRGLQSAGGARLGTRGEILPGGAECHAGHAGGMGSIWTRPKGDREIDRSGDGLSTLDCHRHRFGGRASSAWPHPKDPGQDRGGRQRLS